MPSVPTDLLSLKDACHLIPSPRGGTIHLNSLRRWCLSGRLRYWKQGPWMFVSRADLAALFTPQEQPAPVLEPSLAAAEAFLRARGL